MLDAVNLERRSIPAAVVGVDRLLETTGAAMARSHGYPDLEMAAVPFSAEAWGGAANRAELVHAAEVAAPQVVRILTLG